MSESAIGLIETRGLVGVIEAADTAAKAADVQLLGIERIGGGFVSVRFRGDTASVQMAVRAGREAAERVSELVSAHVIPSPQLDVEAIVGAPTTRPSSAAAQDTAALDTAALDTAAPLESLPVVRLRQLARQTPGVSLQGRQVSRANKEQLLEALRAARGGRPAQPGGSSQPGRQA